MKIYDIVCPKCKKMLEKKGSVKKGFLTQGATYYDFCKECRKLL